MEGYILEAIQKFSLLEQSRNITVALSGGADSMSLLYALLALKDELDIEVSAAHLNHMIRGEEALRDEAFVTEQCKKLGVKLFVERADVPLFAKTNNISTELAARELRYEFLQRVSCGVVATAHTASDSLETVLFNIARGTAIDGLCGIPPKRDIFIRPLLLCTRKDVEEYCDKNGIPFVTDSTNLGDEYTRNKIRHKAVPVLKEINPNIENTLLRMVDSLREDKAVLENIADEYLFKNLDDDNGLLVEDIASLKPAIAKRVIIRFIERLDLKIEPQNVHICSVYDIAVSGGRTSLPKNFSALVENKKLFIKKNDDIKQKKADFKVEITEICDLFFEKTKKINNLLLNNSLDCDKIVGNWSLRTRRAGDSIRLLNRGCTKTLSQLYNEKRIPVALREDIPVIADEKGIIWIYGIGVAARCAVSQNTKKAYKIDVKEKDLKENKLCKKELLRF